MSGIDKGKVLAEFRLRHRRCAFETGYRIAKSRVLTMKKIDFSKLQPGDILLTTSHAAESWSVRFGTKSDVSHAMLYVASSSVIDSTMEGVHARNLQKIFYEDDCVVHALRPVKALATEALQAVIQYARLATGSPYTLGEAVRAVKRTSGSGSKKQFCSRLVARAYAAAGVNLVENPDFCTPQQLKESPLLQILESPAVSVSEEEVAEIRSQPNRAEGMIQVTNEFLKKVRGISPRILAIEDAFQFLVDNQSIDAKFHDALKSSGYLDYWQVERREFHWRYDLDAMKQFVAVFDCAAAVADYCETTLRDDAVGTFWHWKQTLQASRENYRRFPLKSFASMVTLYENLVEGAEMRVSVAQQWLASQK